MSQCSECGAQALVTETRRNQDGDVRRRFRCKECSFVWTELNGPRPKTVSAVPDVRVADAVILDILTDKSSQAVLAKRHGCSCSAVGKIRRGELHPDVHPEIPRTRTRIKQSRKTCKKCIHYTGSRERPCDLGHIDPVEEGLTFATYCSNFHPSQTPKCQKQS